MGGRHNGREDCLNASLDEDQGDTFSETTGNPRLTGLHDVGGGLHSQKAGYGLKRSPRLWGLTHGRELHRRQVEVEGEVYMLEPLLSEPQLWKVISAHSGEEGVEAICGLLMTYVDDLFMVSKRRILLELIKGISDYCGRTWIPSLLVRFKSASTGWTSPRRTQNMELFGG